MKKILTGALALILFTGAAVAQSKDSSKHHHRGHEKIGKELNLSAEQKAKMKSIHEAQQKEMQALTANTTLTSDQQKAKRTEIRKKYGEQVKSVFTPEQKAQMEKNRAEWKEKAKEGRKDGKGKHGEGRKGKGFKKGGDMGAQLNLTAEQKEKMAALRTESKAKAEAIKNDASLTEEQKKAKMKELRMGQSQSMKSVLTKEQLEKMESFRKERKEKSRK